MKKSYFYSIGLTLAIIGSSCSRHSGSQTHTEGTDSTGLDSLAYHFTTFKEFSPYISGEDSTQRDTTYFSASYPIFDSRVDSLIKAQLFIDGEDKASQVAQSFLSGFNEYAEEQMAAGSQTLHGWFKEQNCDIILNVPGFLTLRNRINEYTGGAHGMYIELWSNYDIRLHQTLSLEDLIQDTTALKEITESYFRKQEGLADTSSYGNDYFFEDETFVLADNFGLTKSGLLFYYNLYEIKPYVAGPTELLIPYQALRNILTKKGQEVVEAIKTT